MEQTTSRLILTNHLVSLFKRTPSKIIDKVIYLVQSKLHPDYEGIELGIAEKMALRALSQSSASEMHLITIISQNGRPRRHCEGNYEFKESKSLATKLIHAPNHHT